MTSSRSDSSSAVLAIVLFSYLMIVLDISIVITGIPKIQADLGVSQADLSWVQNAYLLAFGGLLLLGARAGDILGRRRMFLLGLGLFTAASAIVGAAPSAAILLAGRGLQGVGAAILAPSTLALLSTNFPDGPERTRAFGLYGSIGGIGSTIGLVLGGIVADWLSWRVAFFINLPVGLVLGIAAVRVLNETERHPGRFDLVGAITGTLGTGALVYALVRSTSTGWSDPTTIGVLSAGLALLAGFVLTEARAAQPVMPLRLFASRERCSAYLARALFVGAVVGFYFFTTQLLQDVLRYSPSEAGLAFLWNSIPNFAAAMTVPRLTKRFGNAGLLAGGFAIGIVGLLLLGRVTADTPYLLGVALPLLLVGAGQGAVLAPLTVAGVAGVAARDTGAASGLVNVAHQIGGSLGLGLLVAVAALAGAGASDARTALVARIDTAFTGGAVMLALALVVVLAVGLRSRKRDPDLPEAGLPPAVEAVATAD